MRNSNETLTTLEVIQDDAANKRFQEVIDNIDMALTSELEADLDKMPVMKPSGSADQGYRHN